jgi:uncharacterized membrane protein required for colicin V production
MHYLDIVFLAIALAGFFLGWRLRAMQLLGIVLSLTLGVWLANQFSVHLQGMYIRVSEPGRSLLAWVSVFLGATVIIAIITSLLAHTFQSIHLEWLDHALGGFFALLFGLAIFMIFVHAGAGLSSAFRMEMLKKSKITSKVYTLTVPLFHFGEQHSTQIKQIMNWSLTRELFSNKQP